MLKIGELFAGIGAPRMALRDLGIEHESLFAIEWEEKAVRSYNAIFNDNIKPHDITKPYDYPNVDILIHGSPCQDFSLAGAKRGGEEGSGTQSSLLFETVRIIGEMEKKPKVVIWENVRSVLFKNNIGAFNKYLEYMESLGYKNNYKILNSENFGLPQRRRRVFVVSSLEKEFDFNLLNNSKPKYKATDILEKDTHDKYLITSPSMLRNINKPKNYGGGLKELGDIAETITTKQDRVPNSGIVNTDKGYRLLTEKETWLLMGFSEEDYYKAKEVQNVREGSKSVALYMQAGNSIALPVIKELLDKVIKYYDL